MANNYRINFLKSGRYGSDTIFHQDVFALSEEDAMTFAQKLAEREGLREKGCDEIMVEEIPQEPSPIGIKFKYRDTAFKQDFTGYIIIRANSEKEAKEFYERKLKGTRFWFDASEIVPDGKCVRGEVVSTYFAACPGWDFDATKEEE